MKIADLKQPYRRMAEYLAEKNTYTRFKNKEILNDSFDWYETNVIFWLDIADGYYPPITEEIKQHFPPDFDFSGDVNEKVNLHKELFNAVNVPKEIKEYKMSLFDKENQRKIEDENLQNRIYTQLAREGKFEQLPDTCEFSEGVELEVMICNDEFKLAKVHGKFKGRFMCVMEDNTGYLIYKEVRLPSTTPKIDFSQFKSGDVLEITNKDNEKYYGLLYLQTINELVITLGYNSKSSKHILKDNILSITKIK